MKRYFKRLILIVIDTILIIFSLALAISLANPNPALFLSHYYLPFLFCVLLIKISVYFAFRLYSSIWKYASIHEMVQVCTATAAASTLVLFFLYPDISAIWVRIIIIDWMLNILMIGGIRLGLRILASHLKRDINNRNDMSKDVLIYGAGKIGADIIKELLEHPMYNPTGIIDDDIIKQGTRIHGVPVLADRTKLKDIICSKGIKELILAIPSLDKIRLRDTLAICKSLDCRVKILPGINDLINGKINIKQVRDINIEDLLGRAPVTLNLKGISEYINNQIILITGGGGSIGSELCRQIAQFNPSALIVLDINENDPYMLQQELNYKFPELNTKFLIGSIADAPWIESVFMSYRPDVVFHAAAHKHVPLMEENICEAVKNNVFGTLNIAQNAARSGVKRFVLISTDKAVNPTSIMGVTKRISELIVQQMNSREGAIFSAVRFGNVLGSNGSVLPLFKKQIEWSNSIRITHPDVTRYFMTIPEAVQLVIQAGAMARGREVFVLDMGTPVKIFDLAKDLLKLLDAEDDTKIVFTGLRPGEKLNEELFLDIDSLENTHHKKIFKETVDTDIDFDKFNEQLNRLRQACMSQESDIISILKDMIPDYIDENQNTKLPLP